MRIRTLALAGTAALLLAGCGGGDPSGTAASPAASPSPTEDTRTGRQVLADAVAALKGSGAARATGTFTMEGKEAGIDMQLQDDGASGTLTLEGQEIELLVVRQEAYIKAGDAFWSTFGVPPAAVELISGEWLLMPAAQAAELGPLSLEGFADELLTPDSAVVDEVGTGQVDGQDVLVVSTEDGSTLSVLAGEDSYPVLVESARADNPGELALSGFGERQPLEAPEDFVDIEKLGG